MRLIDATALINRITKKHGLTEIILDVDESPTIDALPIKHGRWSSDCVCSECGEVPRSGMEENYCPNCGAKMDEVEE